MWEPADSIPAGKPSLDPNSEAIAISCPFLELGTSHCSVAMYTAWMPSQHAYVLLQDRCSVLG